MADFPSFISTTVYGDYHDDLETREKVREAYAGAALRVVAGRRIAVEVVRGAGSDDPITGNLYSGQEASEVPTESAAGLAGLRQPRPR